MNKYLKFIILFFLLSTLAFAKWELKEVIDEFQEGTGVTRLLNKPVNIEPPDFAEIAIQKNITKDKEEYMGALITNQTVAFEVLNKIEITRLKVKTEKSNIYEIIGIIDVSYDYILISFLLNDELIESMKKSKTLKIIYNTSHTTTQYLEFNIKNTEKFLKKLKPSIFN